MRPVQGVFRHIIHEHIQPIFEVKEVTTIPTKTEAAISMKPPWRRDNKVDDFDVWFQASSSVASKNALLAVIITVVAVAMMMTLPLVV